MNLHFGMLFSKIETSVVGTGEHTKPLNVLFSRDSIPTCPPRKADHLAAFFVWNVWTILHFAFCEPQLILRASMA